MPKEITINVEQLEKLLESYSNDFIELTGGKVEETIDLFDLLLTNILELNVEEQKKETKEHKGKLIPPVKFEGGKLAVPTGFREKMT